MSADRGENGGLGKWISGVLSSVIGGVALWWLTSPVGPLAGKEPSVVISDFTMPEMLWVRTQDGIPSRPMGDRALAQRLDVLRSLTRLTAKIDVHNQGDAAAENCHVLLHRMLYRAQPDAAPVDSETYISDEFTVLPAQTRRVEFSRLDHLEPGTHEVEASATCRNTSSGATHRSLDVKGVAAAAPQQEQDVQARLERFKRLVDSVSPER